MAYRMGALLFGLLGGAVLHAADFELISPDIGPDKPLAQEFVYNGFGCTGGNRSFALSWSGAPAGTQRYVITHFDPDARRGSGFWRRFVVNIPANTTSLPRDAGAADNSKLPSGAQQLRTSFGNAAFGGSCPPPGDKPHNYIVTVYVMKARTLEWPADATAALPLVEANALGKATLTYQFGR